MHADISATWRASAVSPDVSPDPLLRPVWQLNTRLTVEEGGGGNSTSALDRFIVDVSTISCEVRHSSYSAEASLPFRDLKIWQRIFLVAQYSRVFKSDFGN